MPQRTPCLLRATARLFVLSLFVFLVWAPSGAFAQTAGEGTITGTVTDNTGAVIADATVTATNIATNVSATRTTTKDGLYTIAPSSPGPMPLPWRLRASRR